MLTLKRCPFCGAEAKAELAKGLSAVVFCSAGCSAETICEINTAQYAIPYNVLEDAFIKAALKWNTRA